MITAPSNRSEFTGFSDYFEAEIAPYLAEKEALRQRAVKEGATLAAAAVAFGAVVFFLGGESDVLRFFLIFVIFVAFAVAGYRINRAREKITLGLMQKICGQLGIHYRRELKRPYYFPTFERLKLMPSFNREAWEDEVRGARQGVEFIFCEAHLRYQTSGKNRSTRTVFHGQLMVIDFPHAFHGETVVKRDRGVFNQLMKPASGFQRVGIASPKFEKIFEAWSTDQVEARTLLDPLVLERFEELERIFQGAELRAAFVKGKLYVALETGDALNMGSMFKPLNGAERVEEILKEFDIIFDLIDILVKPVNAPMAGAFSVEDVKK
ncbi:MAG: DUF3137 domain-containing protein [Pseudomonadota bacterium]